MRTTSIAGRVHGAGQDHDRECSARISASSIALSVGPSSEHRVAPEVEQLGDSLLLGASLGDTAEDDFELVRAAAAYRSEMQVRMELVPDTERDAEQVGAFAAQQTRSPVGPEAELGGGPADPLTILRAGAGEVSEHDGDQRPRHAGPGGDVLHGRGGRVDAASSRRITPWPEG